MKRIQLLKLQPIAVSVVGVWDVTSFLNQAHAGRRPACAWFLEITFVPPKYVCVCVCVSTPEAINN